MNLGALNTFLRYPAWSIRGWSSVWNPKTLPSPGFARLRPSYTKSASPLARAIRHPPSPPWAQGPKDYACTVVVRVRPRYQSSPPITIYGVSLICQAAHQLTTDSPFLVTIRLVDAQILALYKHMPAVLHRINTYYSVHLNSTKSDLQDSVPDPGLYSDSVPITLCLKTVTISILFLHFFCLLPRIPQSLNSY